MADTKTIAILGALGAAVYGYYQGWFASLGLPAPTTATTGSTATGTTTTAGTTAAPPTTTSTSTNTMAPVTPPAAPSASPGGGGPGTQPSLLASQLVAAAGGGNPTLTVDQWNYYLQQIQPSTNSSAITGALSTLGINRGQSNFSMTASQYTGYLAQLNLAGLSGLGYVPSGRVPRSVIQAARWRHR